MTMKFKDGIHNPCLVEKDIETKGNGSKMAPGSIDFKCLYGRELKD